MLTHALIGILTSEMEQWHPNNLKPGFFPRSAESSFNFLFNYNFDPFPGIEVKQPEMMMRAHMAVPAAERGECEGGQLLCGDPKKKRLTSEQLESLENSFQDEIKLEPDRKLKLARELGLQPRQVAVWFQNRRARWKTKQLERLYDSLKLEFDAVSREKQKLQDEVMKLRAMLMDQATRFNNLNATKQVSIGCTEASGGDETVESTSEAATHGGPAGGSQAAQQSAAGGIPPQQSLEECQYLFSAGDDYNTVASPTPSYWAALPSYPC